LFHVIFCFYFSRKSAAVGRVIPLKFAVHMAVSMTAAI